MNERGIAAPSSESFVTAWAEGEARAERCRQRQQRRRLVRGTREVLATVVLAVVIFLGTHSAVQGREVEGPSMQPNYHAGQRLFINKLLYTRINAGKLLPFVDDSVGSRYLLHGPRRGEVMVFRSRPRGRTTSSSA